jgi:two-component system, response regulator YesN
MFQKITSLLQKQIAQQLQDAGAAAVVCGRAENAEKISGAYKNMLDLIKYRVFFNKGHIFELGAIRSFEEDYKYPTQLEQQIIQSLRLGDVQKASDNYYKMLQVISDYRYDHFRFSVKRLYVSIQILIKELQEQGCFKIIWIPG